MTNSSPPAELAANPGQTPKRKPATRATKGQRLTAEAWIEEAGKVLADQGIDAVRVEPIAKRLKVTKGSFYWHFKDRNALLQALLDDWRRKATSDIIERLQAPELKLRDRLHKLLELYKQGPRSAHRASLEMAIRQWAKADKGANEVLTEIDARRHQFIENIYKQLGFDNQESGARAFLLYSTMMGVAYLPNLYSEKLLEECEKILLSNIPFQ